MLVVCWSIVFLAVGTVCQPIVDGPCGRVAGWEKLSRDGRRYQAWTGIPYAEPPVGNLRFKAPKPAPKWSGVLNTTDDPPSCLQQGGFGSSHQSEDCLYLNVYRPENGMQKMPVIVRVHGGAFQVGSMGPRQTADYLMDEDIVLVTIQYRLNGIGFMSLGDKAMPGNFGIKDQVLALKWVQNNIAAFGGEPNSVTVIGDSAGGASTHFLLKTPAADDLVHRAQSDSGTVNRFWSLRRPEIVRDASLTVAEKVGCDISRNNQEIFECLQAVEGQALLQAMGNTFTMDLKFVPCIEPEGSEDAVATEDISVRPVNKPWITSNTNGEFMLFKMLSGTQQVAKNEKDLDAFLKEIIKLYQTKPDPSRISEGVQLLKDHYFPARERENNLTIGIAQARADVFFPYAALYNLQMHQGPKWFYFFEYVSQNQRHITNVAFHADQTSYYFNTRSSAISAKETPEDYAVSKRMIKYLVNFAYHDDPTPPNSPMKWDQFAGTEMMRVTNCQNDFMAEPSVVEKLLKILTLWDNVLGRES